MTLITIATGTLGPKKFGKNSGIGKQNGDHPDHIIVKISKNIQKNRRDLKRFAVN